MLQLLSLSGTMQSGMDGFTLFRMTEGLAAIVIIGNMTIHAVCTPPRLCEEITLLSAARTGNRTVHTACPPLRHCERSEESHAGRLVWFTRRFRIYGGGGVET
jgi:hypothetical protein